MSVRIYQDDAREWRGNADMVFTHPYGPIPPQLHGKPSLINVYQPSIDKVGQVSEWLGGAKLWTLSKWGVGLQNTLYVANASVAQIGLEDLVEDMTDALPGHGWFPVQLPLRVLSLYTMPGKVLWDGFAGRGTVGLACVCYGMHYIGIDWNAGNYARMLNFLERYIDPKELEHGTRQ